MADNSENSYQPPFGENDAEERLEAGDFHVSTWWTYGEPESLKHAVIEYRAALLMSPLDDSEWRMRGQISLSDALRLQFEEGVGDKADEEDLFREALDLAEGVVAETSPPSALHLQALRALAQTLQRRFHTKEHLQRTTDTSRDLVGLLTDSNSMLITALSLYSNTLIMRFDHESKDSALLKLANAAVDRALALVPEGEHASEELIHAQSNVRAEYGNWSHDLAVIDEAIEAMQGHMDRIAPRHPRVHFFWSLLALSYAYRQRLSGTDEDLDRLVTACDQSRKSTPPSHPLWLTNQGNCAFSLYQRFESRGELRDLQDAIEVSRAVVSHITSGPAGRSHLKNLWISNLADYLANGYWQTGDLQQLDEAIGLHMDNLKSVPLSRRAGSLHSIAVAYRSRFLTQGRLTDLQRAGALLEQALECPLESRTHADIVYTHADILLAMYNEHNDVCDLNKAISLLKTFLASDALQPQMRAQHESLLGLALLSRAAFTAPLQALEESAKCQKRALKLLPQEDPRRYICYFRLGLAEFQAFAIGRQQRGVTESIASFSQALSIMPSDHPRRASYLSHLSKSLLAMSGLRGSSTAVTFSDALTRLREAATHSMSWPVDRYEAAIQWAGASHRSEYHAEAIEAYRLAISLLPQLASVHLENDLIVQHIGKQARDVPQDAAACALELGQPELAIELLEAGRTLLWNARQELRADLARLRQVAPDLARELAQTNAALEFRLQSEPTTTSDAECESDRRRLHRLVSRRTELIREIRSQPGFDQFLEPPTFSSLRHAAADGPVVVLNASVYRCDAIVIQTDEQVVILSLPGVTYDQIQSETSRLQYSLAAASRDRKSERFLDVTLRRLLQWLWQCIGSPVCSVLQEYLADPEPRRVWWCPTGALSFLPIHACGPYDDTQLGMPDIVISSYTPTLSALLRARREKSVVEFPSRFMLAASQPSALGHLPLPGAMDEMEVLKCLFSNSGTFLVGPAASLSAVEAFLRQNSWFHVISHGTQNSMNPLESAIALHDGPLTLSRLAQARLPHAEFAFLSACHSAKGTTWLPDESMHLAAGMVFAGFKGVVATSWAIADKDAPNIAREFYTYLIKKRWPPLATDAAEALHMAVKTLRKSGVGARRWVPFIHLGA